MRLKQTLIAAIFFVAVLAGCSEQNAQIVSENGPIDFIEPEAEFPRIRFADGQVSLNDRCPVRKVKLNRRMPPIYVNGKPIGFC